MRNEVVLDLAEFSRAKNRTVQSDRIAVGNRSRRNNRRIPGGRIQNSRSVTRSRTVSNGKTAQNSREAVSSGERRITRQRLWEQKRQKRLARQRMVMVVLLGVTCVCFFFMFIFFFKESGREDTIGSTLIQEDVIGDVKNMTEHPVWTEDFLTVNEYSRPGTPITEVKDIFVHYTANPNTDAVNNRSYFEQLKDTHERSASAHFIIGYGGDILQCIPLDEMAYAVKTRNEDSLSIECCYHNEDGSFTQETYDSLVELLAWLVNEYDLTTDNILRHYDCGGKKCPLYYTEHEDAWEQLKMDVDKVLMDL